MSTPYAADSDLASLVRSLREQIAEKSPKFDSRRGRNAGPGLAALDPQLHENLSSLLDRLSEVTKAEEAAEQPSERTATRGAAQLPPQPWSESVQADLVQVVDQQLAHWQAQISLAYTQAASQELVEHLQLAERLSHSLQLREQRLESQRQQLEQRLAELLQREARTVRQRTTIARTLRARQAEMLLAVERQQLAYQTEASVIQANEDQQVGALQRELGHLKQELQNAHSDLATAEGKLASARSQADQLCLDTQTLNQELVLTRAELKLALERPQPTPRDEAEQQAVAALQQQLADAQTELAELRQLCSDFPAQSVDSDSQADTITRLQAELEMRCHQVEELRSQNSDLAAQVARHQVVASGSAPHVSFQSESLSWEERKRLIMQQLEAEAEEPTAKEEATVERHLEIEQILLSTQAEIDKRDREIAELQSIIEQQSDARQGVAIGAAAFAQMFDNDEIIQQEREKLKQIQHEWEEKLRQAEIDVSLERAKLARERTQLELELENTKREKAGPEPEPDKSKKRRWLEHLGLKDDGRREA